MSCCATLVPPSTMLTLSQVSLLVSKVSPMAPLVSDIDNNNGLGCGALALKMMSSRALLGTSRTAGPKRCLFGTPSPVDTQRLLREDQDAVKARMARRWGLDLNRGGPAFTLSSNWQWESGKTPRRHPYAVRLSSPRTAAIATPAPSLVSPSAVMNTSAASSSSGTSTLPASPDTPDSPDSPTVLRETQWNADSESVDSCCGDSGSESESDSSTSCSRQQHSSVQTRLTDFWRTRRCSASEGAVKPTGTMAVPPTRTSARTCSV